MASTQSLISLHFRNISSNTSPRSFRSSRLFRHANQDGSTSELAREVQALAAELGHQSDLVGNLANAVAGSHAALAQTATSVFGGSVLGGIADSISGGFSWKSLIKDVLPFGGLVSGIAGLFHSSAVPAPLQQYDAPSSLGFSGVLASNRKIFQASSDASGTVRAAFPGLDLADAEGGPRSPYSRRPDGSLASSAGAPASRYPGTLDISSAIRGLVEDVAPVRQNTASAPARDESASFRKNADDNAEALPGNPKPPSPPGQTPSVPTFDSTWFMDHAPYIAAAVRNAMLDSHPILDVINDL